jgi:uncharacterized repeat protein (TIGR02543 family)
MHKSSPVALVLVALILSVGWLGWSFGALHAGIYSADERVTYKEYWVPHSEYTGGQQETTPPSCLDTTPAGGSWYIEPITRKVSGVVVECVKTLRITIPDDFSAALKAELYLDLWRSRKTFSAQYRINNGDWRTATAGQEWSRSPYLVEIPLNELATGLNTLQFRDYPEPGDTQSPEPYHLHDVGIRIYFDQQNPLRNSQGQPIQAPQGELLSVWADNGEFSANAGGVLEVNDDQLVLTARLTTPAKFVEFHGYYRGYDLDVNDSDGDGGALDTEWHNRGRNNFQVGGLAPLERGGTQDHIGTIETSGAGDYSIHWPIPTVINQSGVRFKIRIVDADGVVSEAAGGPSALFTLSRTGAQATHWVPNFSDFILYSGGSKPLTVTRTININSDLANFQEAFLIGSYWENPTITLNGTITFTAFTTLEDKWALSVRPFAKTALVPGLNTIRYAHVTQTFGEFVEKPGPLILLKQTTQTPDASPPTITGSTPAPGASNVASNSTVAIAVADSGRGVNFNTLKLKINGALVTPIRSGTPDEYTLTYTPEAGWQPGGIVTVSLDACDFADNCMSTSNHTFSVQLAQYALTVNSAGDGVVVVNPLQDAYHYGDVVTLTAAPNAGAQFVFWSTQAANWWDGRWDYRAPITVQANGYARQDRPVELSVNFTALLNGLGQPGLFDPQSLRVVEVSSAGAVIDDHVPFQFDRAGDYHAANNAAGLLIFLVKGATPANGVRHYHLYFDKAGKNFAAPGVGDQVMLTSMVDEFWGSYRIATTNATYAYHLQGGGFSSLVDVHGNDWIDYHDSPPDSGGAFRGVPNLVPPPDGLFHPGKINHTTWRVASGPLKETFRTKTFDNKWEVQWEIYPTYATMTVLKRPNNKNYWWLYEGTPGGVLENTGTLALRDFVTLSNGVSFKVDQSYEGDLAGEEWVFIGDPDVDNAATAARSIFLIHHADDTAIDSHRTQVTGGAFSPKKMTVWGFGRNLTNNTAYLTAIPNRFSIGLMDETTYATGATVINGVYRDQTVALGAPVWRGATTHPSDTATLHFTITGDTTIDALFAQQGSVYTLNTSTTGNGAISHDPAQAAYLPGQVVTLRANPSPGWAFSQWTGDLSGGANPATLTMNGDHTVMATFVQAEYEVTVNITGTGMVVRSPDLALYPDGSQVTLSATPAPDWLFAGWSGDHVGTETPALLTVNSNLVITATFVPAQVTLDVIVVGSGSVTKEPDLATYPYGSVATLTATPASGWVFAGWTGDVTDTLNPVTVDMLGNRTVTATFMLETYPLTTTVLGSGTLSKEPDLESYLANSEVTLSATPDSGWSFAGWGGDLSGTTTPAMLLMDGPKEVTATFSPISYTLMVDVDGNGVVSANPNQSTYLYEDAVLLAATPDPGWRFDHWSGDLTGSENPVAVIITGNLGITAHFVQEQYTVSIGTVGSGSVAATPDLPTYLYNDLVTFTANPGPGWFFEHWEGDLTGSISPLSVTITESKVITAVFVVTPLVLTTSVNGPGQISKTPEQATYIYGDQVTVTAQPASGSVFTGWGGDLSGNQNPTTITMDGDKSIIANFGQSQVTLARTVEGGGRVIAIPDKAFYDAGETVALIAVADLDWRFDGWSGGLNGAANPATMVMDSNKSVTARFVEDSVTGVVKSDDFNHCAYSTRFWSWHDPLGDAPPPQITGEEIRLSVPGGATHDVWTNGIEAPHLMQMVNNQDFDLYAKFNSPFSAQIQLQGILIKEQETRALRINFQREGNTQYLFVGLVRSGQNPQRKAKVEVPAGAPMSLRIQRTGNDWTILYRIGEGEWLTDPALSFTQNLMVSSTGLFVGNAPRQGAPPPAFTAVVDYFVNNAQPLPAEDPIANLLTVKISGEGTVSKSVECGNPVELTAHPAPGWRFVRWEESTPAGTRTLGEANPLLVAFGKESVVTAIFELTALTLDVQVVGSGVVQINPRKETYDLGEKVTLTAAPQAGWVFGSWSGDLTGANVAVEITMQTSKQITATFLQLFTLNLVLDPAGGQVRIEPQKAQYADGETVTLTALPHPGYEFVEWIINGEVVRAGVGSTENPLTLTIRANMTVEARFAVMATNQSSLFLPLVSSQ